MLRRKQPIKRRTFVKFHLAAALVLAAAAVWQFSRYVNTTVKPTLHQLAEYEARSATVQAMQSAVSAQLQTVPDLCEALYTQQGELVQLNTARANAAKIAADRCRTAKPGRTSGDGLSDPLRQPDQQQPAQRPWPGVAVQLAAAGLRAGKNTRNSRITFHQHHTLYSCAGTDRHRQYGAGWPHRDPDRDRHRAACQRPYPRRHSAGVRQRFRLSPYPKCAIIPLSL